MRPLAVSKGCVYFLVDLQSAPLSTLKRFCATSSSSSSFGGDNGAKTTGGEKFHRTAATPGDRRRMTRNWENAFFGRVHYEPGMHEKFKSAVDMEYDAAVFPNTKSNRELFPDWPEDQEAPLHEFRRLPDDLKRHYIVNRLASGERHIVYSEDYGSLLMMQHLNLGELMINEGERLLQEFGWMNTVVAEKIETVRDHAIRIKFEYDLD